MKTRIKIKWKSGEDLIAFPLEDIIDRPRNHALDLFNRNISIAIRQDNVLISNSKEIRHLYHKKSQLTVMSLDQVTRSEKLLSEVGFI